MARPRSGLNAYMTHLFRHLNRNRLEGVFRSLQPSEKHVAFLHTRIVHSLAEFKYLRTNVNQNCIPENINSRRNTGNQCLIPLVSENSVFWVSYPKRNLHINVNINIIFHVVLCGCKTWSLILRRIMGL